MNKQRKKQLWVLMVAILLFSSMLAFVFYYADNDQENSNLEKDFFETLIINQSLNDQIKGNIIQNGFTLIEVKSNQSYYNELKQIQEDFKTSGNQKQIVIENLQGNFSLKATSQINSTELSEPNFTKLEQDLCNIVLDPPIQCFDL
jgi:hypothetical protein